MRVTFGFWIALLVSGCVDRGTVGGGETSAPDDDDPGVRPLDGMYAQCSESEECEPLEFCVFPAGEFGFCTDRCASPDDATACDPSSGGNAIESCLDIGLPDGDRVCALDCGGGKSCPAQMRCEGIENAAGEQRVCF